MKTRKEYRREAFLTEQAKRDVGAAAHMLLIADAEFGRIFEGSKTIGPATQKVILVVLAGHEGSPISNRGIAARTGCSPDTVQRATRAMESLGILSITADGPNKTNVYRIDWDALATFQTEEMRYSIGGVRARFHDRTHMLDRARRRSKCAALKSLRELGVAS